MCGRYVLYGPENRIIEGFTLFEPDPFSKVFSKPFTPRYNIAPTADVWVVSANAQNQRELRNVRSGLIPNWAKDASMGAKMNNARAETVAEKPSFRNAFKRSRCLNQLLRPCPDHWLAAHPVGVSVNQARNDDFSLILPSNALEESSSPTVMAESPSPSVTAGSQPPQTPTASS